MKKYSYSLLSLSIISIFYSNSLFANLNERCLLGVPHFTGELVEGDFKALPVYIEADAAEVVQASSAIYTGNVNIKQGNRTLQTDRVEIFQQGNDDLAQRYALIQGNIDYRDNLIELQGDNAKINLNNKEAELNHASYQFIGRQGRGSAEHASINEGYRVLKNATFTSCLQNDNAWHIKAAEMKQHIKEQYADLWHARFYVKNVPIFYLPYAQFPTGDQRRSGLLIPSVGTSSRDGYYYAQPIYWNIAPNFDITVTPKYLSRRGIQTQLETRYLTTLGSGLLAGEYLKKDRRESLNTGHSRYLFFWKHNSTLAKNWNLGIDYTKVSDRNYFNHFSTNYGKSTDGYATQNIYFSYYQPNYNLTLSATQFQVFDVLNIAPYRTQPQLKFNWYRYDIANTNLNAYLYSEITQFKNKSEKMPQAWRFHIQPNLNLPLNIGYLAVNLDSKLYATHYQQRTNSAAAPAVKKHINRVIPQFKIDVSTTLTNNQLWNNYTQTIEPRVQYLYRPYHNQAQIGSSLNNEYLGFGYDSTLLQQDYYSLFNERRYSGLDRISSANQITAGVTTRLFDQNFNERFNISIGQIYYISSSRIDDLASNNSQKSSSAWALDTNWKINNYWNAKASYQYDPSLGQTALANFSIEFNPKNNNLIQLNYRFASQEYIDQNLTSSINKYQQDINQLGITTAWAIDDQWAIVAKHYQDISIHKPVEQYLGVQYSTCCWSINVGAYRHLTSTPKGKNDSKTDVYYDNGFGINFKLELGNGNIQHNINEMLNKGILHYSENYSLK